MSAIPIQPFEQAAREQYQLLIAAAAARRLPSGEGALAIQARLELAEMLAARDSHDVAMEMLARALENNPSPELAERIRLRLASSFLAKKNTKAALAQVELVTKNPASPVAAEARYLAGEAAIQLKDWGKAIEQLIVFRDQGKFQNVHDVADRALLRLGQAFAEAGRWDDSRRSFETLVSRFPRSPWVEPARYGMGWAWQKQGQWDQAASAYAQVTQRTAAQVAAQAQLQIGLCRLAQQRFEEAAKALLVVPFTYDYPTLNAEAWCEAAKAYLQLKQTPEAVKLWQRVIQDHPTSSWAEVAKQSLAKIK